MKKRNLFAETAGWHGISAVLLAYLLVSFDVIASDSITYQLLNLTGAVGVVIISVHKKVSQTVALNIIWASIALVALLGLLA